METARHSSFGSSERALTDVFEGGLGSKAKLFFNVRGREFGSLPGNPISLKNSYWVAENHDPIVLLFVPDSLKEGEPGSTAGAGEFAPDMSSVDEMYRAYKKDPNEANRVYRDMIPRLVTPEGKANPNSEYGFIAGYDTEVPVRDYRGFCVCTNGDVQLLAQKMKTYYDSTRDSQYLMPVYDLDGNMIWPAAATHDDIAKLKSRNEP